MRREEISFSSAFNFSSEAALYIESFDDSILMDVTCVIVNIFNKKGQKET